MQIQSAVRRILFESLDDSFAILELRNGQTAKGRFFRPRVDDVFAMECEEERHPKYGMQLAVKSAKRILPREPKAIIDYLWDLHVKETTAKKILAALGHDCLDQISDNDSVLLLVPDLSFDVLRTAVDWLCGNRQFEQVWSVLQEAGLNKTQIAAAQDRYGRGLWSVVQGNPYQLCYDVDGISFRNTDQVALSLGWGWDSPERAEAAIRRALFDAGWREGHTWITDWEDRALYLLSEGGRQAVPHLTVQKGLQRALESDAVIQDGDRVFAEENWRSERNIADCIRTIMRFGPAPFASESQIRTFVREDSDTPYSNEQIEAILLLLSQSFSILTGGAGTGKSTVMQAVVRVFQAMCPDASVHLAAPTGKAAKRLSDIVGAPAKTIHRLLSYGPTADGFDFGYNDQFPLPPGLVIIDEASMLTAPLAAALLRAIPASSRVVLVGDPHQLLPIGPGDVLRDLLLTDVPCAELTQIFRQAAGSSIALAGQSIVQGRYPSFGGDCTLIEPTSFDDGWNTLQGVVDSLRNRRVSMMDWQVIVPQNTGLWGVEELNRRLQIIWNPANPNKAELSHGNRVFRVGDKVMQIKNNYETEVFNGDVGYVTAIVMDPETHKRTVCVNFDERPVLYAGGMLSELRHAYACTVHKYQGSQTPYVVIVLSGEAKRMLNRNLLYTAITRAEQSCLILSSSQIIDAAVTARLTSRQTALGEWMQMERTPQMAASANSGR